MSVCQSWPSGRPSSLAAMTSPPVTPETTSHPDEPTRVRLRDAGDVVASLPALLGYRARSSLVLIVLSQKPRRVLLTMRLDIPPCPGHGSWRSVADAFAPGLRAADGSEAILVQIDGDPEWADEVADALRLRLAQRGMTLSDVIVTADGFYRSRCCLDPMCCPPEGRPVPGSSALAAAAVTRGRVIHASRDELAAEIAAPEAGAAARADRVVELFVATVPHGSLDTEPDAVEALLSRGCAAALHAGEVALDDAVRLALMLVDGDVRDQTYDHLVGAGEKAHRALWASVCRVLPRRYCAAPLAFFALAAYLQGDGAVANVALAAATEIDCAHPTVRLVGDLVAAGVSPHDLRSSLAHAAGRPD